MSLNEMNGSLSRQSTQPKVLETLDDTKPRFSFNSPPLATAGVPGSPMALIHDYKRSTVDPTPRSCDMNEPYSTLLAVDRGQEPAISKIGSIVSRVPSEIILEILTFIVEDGSHHLGAFLFVDKRFYALVTSTPSLWCNINININNEFGESNNLSVPYVDSCLKYSRATGLKIALDMTDVPFPNECMISLAGSFEGGLLHRRIAIDLALEAFTNQGCDESSPFYKFQQQKIEDLVKAVIGAAGIHMLRWKSFKFFPPNPDLDVGVTIWGLFEHPTPNLETFELNDYVYKESSEFNVSFPQLDAVQFLTLPGDNLLKQAPLSYGLLKTLVVGYDQSRTFIDTLGECTGLQELTINEVRGDTLDRRNINFPSLKRLILDGNIGILKNVIFDTPCLESLTLVCDAFHSSLALKARSVLWRVAEICTLWSRAESLRLLVQIKEIEELIVDTGGLKDIIPVIHEIISQRDGNSTPSLRVVRLVDGDIQLDAIHITNE
ncbi:hypothetical protein FRC19_007946 [Serendipita sp. 401]|nr:hypothetical protein FRC19_007946 [Serendipita sp. 401]